MSETKPVANSLEDFRDRFDALADEAAGYGLEAAWVVHEFDRIARLEGCYLGFVGGPIVACGLHRHAISVIRSAFGPVVLDDLREDPDSGYHHGDVDDGPQDAA